MRKTLESFIYSNVNNINDIYKKVEVLFIYFHCNKQKIDNKELLELIETDAYSVEGEKIIFKNNQYDIEFLISYVISLEETKKKSATILVLPNPKKDTKKSSTSAKILSFPQYKKEEQRFILDYIDKLDRCSLHLIEDMRVSFRDILNRNILHILTDSKEEYLEWEMELLQGIVSLYPVLFYAKEQFNREELAISPMIIGSPKKTIEDERLKKIKNTIAKEIKRRDVICLMKKYLNEEDTAQERRFNILQQNIECNIFQLEQEYHKVENMPSVYNNHILEVIKKALEAGTIELLPPYIEPKLYIYNIEQGRTKDIYKMRLSTFKKFFTPASLKEESVFSLKK